MSEGFTTEALSDVVAGAKTSVRVLGVVPFDLDWEHISRTWATSGVSLDVALRCESDNTLFTRAFSTDSAQAPERTTYRQMRVVRDRAIELPELLREQQFSSQAPDTDIKIIHLDVPVSVLSVDDRLFVRLTAPGTLTQTREAAPGDLLYEIAQGALAYALASDGGAKYSAPSGAELLEIFDHDGVPRGVFPRNSFYDTDYTQLVVWALILDRRGRLLIHRRSSNAKDNREMWDKSVGGHVEPSEHADTSHAAIREVIEELFTDESLESGFRPFEVTDSDVVYLGEWRPEVRGRHLFKEAGAYDNKWYFLKLRTRPKVYSPRTMPDGTARRLRVRVDAFVFVASPLLDDDFLQQLKNSAYKLISVNDLKSVMDDAQASKPVPGFDPSNPVPIFSPDLVNIMTGDLRDELQEFAELVRRYSQDG